MATLANLLVRLTADASSYQAVMKSAQKSLNVWGRQMETTGTFLTKSLTVPIVATVGGMAAMTKSAANTGDMLFKMAQRTGVSVEKLSAYRLATKLSDTTMEDFGSSMGRLSKKMFDVKTGSKEARTGFDTLGISVFDSDGKLRSSEEVMLAIADKFRGMEDGAIKTALAIEIFGKSGAGLIPFFNQGSQGIIKVTEESKKLGLEWSPKLAKAAEEFNDNLTRLISGFGALAEQLGKVGINRFGDDLERLVGLMTKSKVATKLVNSLDGLIGRFDKLPDSTKLGIIGITAFAVALGPALFITGGLIRNLKEVIGLMGSMLALASRLKLAGAIAGVAGFMVGKKLLGEPLAESLFPTPTKGPRGVLPGETSAPGAGRQLIPLTHIEKIGGFNVLKPTKSFVPLPGGMPGEGDWRQQFMQPSAFTKESKVAPFPEFTSGAERVANTLLDSKVFQTFERMLSALESIKSSVSGGGKETTMIISQ